MPSKHPSMSTANNASFDFSTPFRYFFNNPDWAKNLLWGTLCLFIPFIGPIILLGWQGRTLRALVAKQSDAVPTFDLNEFAEYLKEGIIPFLANLIIMIPLVFLLFISGIVIAIAVPTLANSTGPMSPAIVIPLILAGLLISLLVIFVFAVFVNAVMTRALLTCDLGQTLQFGAVMTYAKLTWKSVLIMMLVFIPASMLMMILGMIALFVGMYPASIIMNMAGIHLVSQIYQQSLSAGGAPISVSQ